MSGNGTAVGKRIGVQPVLARRAAAAGRNGKRLTTGEQANVRAIVGKGAVASALSRLAKPRRSLETVEEAVARPKPSLPSGRPLAPTQSTESKVELKKPRLHGNIQGVGKAAGLSSEHLFTSGSKAARALRDSGRIDHAAYASHVKNLNFHYANAVAGRPNKLSSYAQMLGGGVSKAAAGTNGMGHLVPQFRGAALKSLVPQAPSFAPKQPKATNTLVAAGGAKPSAPSTAGLSGVAGSSSGGGAGAAAGGVGKASLGVLDSGVKGLKAGLGGWRDSARAIGMGRGARTANTVGRRAGQGLGLVAANPGAAAVGASAGGLAVYGSRKAVGKRRYDPEDERRHRQGALAATGVLGGSALAVSGGKEIARDTKQMRGAPKVLHPGSPPQRGNGYWADMKTKRVRAIRPQELHGEDMAYDVNRKLYRDKLDAFSRLAKPKGAQVTARAGGKLGAGLALVGGGVALHRRRREPRYD